MASSNVQYYEKQKELQDTMTNCEHQRMDLERQLRVAFQADQVSSNMKAARLHSYWKKICEDERRAKQRNERLLREFERIDSHMSEMNARTQRLAFMKKQYEDYIARTYPEWNDLMYGSPQQHAKGKPQETPQQQQKPAQRQQQPAQQQQQPTQQQQQPTQQNKKHQEETITPQEVTEQKQNPQTYSSSTSGIAATCFNAQNQSTDVDHMRGAPSRELQQQSQQQKQQPLTQQQWNTAQSDPEISGGDANFSRGDDGSGVGIYANLPSARSDSQRSLPTDRSDIGRSGTAAQEEMSQPIKSVEILPKSSGNTLQETNGNMQPPEDEEEVVTSDFGSDTDLPMGRSLLDTQIRVDNGATMKQAESKSKIVGSIKPELTIDGLIYLLKLVEQDLREAFSLEGYYRSSWPGTAQKNDIIRKANSGVDIYGVDVNLISMVILEQITLIVRNLAEKSVLPESLLQGDISTLSATKLRQFLSTEAQVIWDALFSHFVQLVRHQVMEPYELSAIFTPCLVADKGTQEKGHVFIVQLLEGIGMDTNENSTIPTWNKPLSPRGTLEGSGSFVEDGRVPPLKFGSLLDKPLSDDESSYINSSLPRDPVPLNETAAYKKMVSKETSHQTPRQVSVQEDTDDDVEKQIASALIKKQPEYQPTPQKKIEIEEPSETSSQTMQTPSHVYVPTAMDSARQNFNYPASAQMRYQGVKISSDLDTDTEVDAGIFGSSRKAEDSEFDFYD